MILLVVPLVYRPSKDKINHNTGGCLYISGVPGTGKTATTQEVVAALREEVNQGMNDKIILYNIILFGINLKDT